MVIWGFKMNENGQGDRVSENKMSRRAFMVPEGEGKDSSMPNPEKQRKGADKTAFGKGLPLSKEPGPPSVGRPAGQQGANGFSSLQVELPSRRWLLQARKQGPSPPA